MSINKFNYEIYALDYLEGNLSPELAADMEAFLKTNPEMAASLAEMKDFFVLQPDTSIVFNEKESLLKEERIYWLKSGWIKPLMAAASIILLLLTYFMGYQAGQNQTIPVIAELSSGLENSLHLDRDLPERPLIVENPSHKSEIDETKNFSTTGTTKPERTQVSTKRKKNKPFLPAASTENKKQDKVLIASGGEQETIAIPLPPTSTDRANISLLPLIASTRSDRVFLTSIHNSNTDSSSELNTQIRLDSSILALNKKPRRRLQQLLGKFPVQNWKEALIPTYYKDDATGQ